MAATPLWFDVGIKRYTTGVPATYTIGLLWFDVGVKRYTTSCIRTTLTNLFNKSEATICEYIFCIFKEEELEEKVVCRNFRQTTQHGALEGKTQSKDVKYYNLEGIISVGYRVKSIRGI